MKKFKEKTTFNNEQSKKLIQLVIEYGKSCEGIGIATADGDIKEKTYWKHQADDAFYEIKELAGQMDYTAYDGPEEFDESGSESDGWFDGNGYLLKPIPGACVVDCSGSGRKDGEVDDWMRELGFDIGFPVAKAVQFLKEFGAWDDLDLLADITKTSDRKKMSEWFRTNGNDEDLSKLMLDPAGFATKVLAQRVLWEFCNEIREQAYETSEEDLESVGLSDDIRDWDDEDWVKFQNELSYVSLNN